MYLKPTANKQVWRHIIMMFLAALGMIFIVALIGTLRSSGVIPYVAGQAGSAAERGYGLTHVHGGTVGFVTTCALAFALWLFTDQREVDDSYVKTTRIIAIGAIASFSIYATTFFLAFWTGGFWLLALFATTSVGLIWFTTGFLFVQARKLDTLTTPHVLFLGGLVTACYGTLLGLLIGIQHITGGNWLAPSSEPIGQHAAPNEAGYLFMVAAGLIEWQLGGNRKLKVTKSGWVQTAALFLSGFSIALALFLEGQGVLDDIAALASLNMLFELIATGVFIGRMWPLVKGVNWKEGSDRFFALAAIWLVISALIFVYFVGKIIGAGEGGAEEVLMELEGLFIGWGHITFMGMMGCVFFGGIAVATRRQNKLYPWGDTAAFWGLNIGVIAFAGGEIAAHVAHGAPILGLAVFLIVFVFGMRIIKALKGDEGSGEEE